MRFLLVVALLLTLQLWAADKYFCPMHCEGPKTYEKAGECPVCHMYLEKEPEPGAETGPLSSKDFRLDYTTTHRNLPSGLQTEVTLSAKRTQDGSAVKDLDAREGFHYDLYVTDQDLTFLEYLRAKADAEGVAHFSYPFKENGNHLIFAVFKPKDVREQVFPLAVKVELPGGKKKNKFKHSILPIGEFGYFVVISEDTTYFHREHAKLSLPVSQKDILRMLPKPGRYFLFQPKSNGSFKRAVLKK